MSQRWTKVILSLLSASLVFSACTKKYSNDDVLPSQYSPSVITGSDNHIVYAYNPSTGAKNWEVNFANSIFASPLVYGGRVYVGTVNYLAPLGACDTLFKLNSRTGAIVKKMWVSGASPFSIKATPIADGKYIFLACTNDSLYAIDTGTGAVSWRFGADGPLVSSPTIANNNVYFASTAGTVYCVDKVNGPASGNVPLWYYTVPLNSFTSSPAISDSFLYIGGANDSNMYCFYLQVPGLPTTGLLKWTYKTKGAILSSPAVVAGKCVFGCSDFNVYCLDTVAGGLNWKHQTNTSVTSSPVIYNSKVYIGGLDNNLYCLNVIDGSTMWFYHTNGSIAASPLIYKGTVYVGSYDKTFWAFDAEMGTVKWTAVVNGQMQCSAAIEDFTGQQHNSQISGYTNY